MKVGVIGRGSIATILVERLKDEFDAHIAFQYHTESKEPYHVLLEKHEPDVVFMAIATNDTGEAARDYINDTVHLYNIPIITCEKGALSYHYEGLKSYLRLVGYSASITGGTMALSYVKERHLNKKEVHLNAVLNGTLNYIFYRLGHGATLAGACAEAGKLGYAEPGATDIVALLNGELKDVTMKICVLYNVALSNGEYISPRDFKQNAFTEDSLFSLNSSTKAYRYIVFMSNVYDSFNNAKLISPLRLKKGTWNIEASFKEIPALSENTAWIPSGVGNVIQILLGKHGEYGECMITGPGAGLRETTEAMLDDARRLLPNLFSK
jgi:homoserine dehydrogenase